MKMPSPSLSAANQTASHLRVAHRTSASGSRDNDEEVKCYRRSNEMSGYTSWAAKLPAIHLNASFEVEDVTPAKVALDSDELYGSGLPRIIGNSDALRRVLDMARVVAPSDATVLINGETGTGKE